jgi:hypothetical protein
MTKNRPVATHWRVREPFSSFFPSSPAGHRFENRFQQPHGFTRIKIGVKPGWPIASGQGTFQAS